MAHFPEKEVIETLVQLLQIPSPTGSADPAIHYLEDRLKEQGISYQLTNQKNLLITLPGRNQEVQRLVTAHVDTLGAMVKEIKENGRLALARIGGYGWFSIDGVYCQVQTLEGKRISGTILHKKSSVHVYEDAGKDPSQETMEVRLDANVKSREDVERLGIRVGDFVSFAPNVEVTETGFVKSRHLDDKACAAILLELVFALQKEQIILPHTTHVLFSAYEEVGFGANSNIPTNVREFLAVDMAAIGDGQASDEYSVTICAMDRSGPYDLHLRKKLVQLAEQNGIQYRIDLYPHYASDASAARLAGHDVICGLIGPGVDASHAYERTHRDALENTYLLLYHYLMSEC